MIAYVGWGVVILSDRREPSPILTSASTGKEDNLRQERRLAQHIGIPTGTFLTGVLFDFAGEEEGWPKGIAETPGIGWLLLTVLLAVAVTVIGSALPAVRAGRSRIIDALRYE